MRKCGTHQTQIRIASGHFQCQIFQSQIVYKRFIFSDMKDWNTWVDISILKSVNIGCLLDDSTLKLASYVIILQKATVTVDVFLAN